jgi:DNA polymerase-1
MLAVEQEINIEDLRRATRRDLNPNSGDQVAELLFDEMQLHLKAPNLKIKRTDSGERLTTNDKVLEALEDIDDTGIVKLITEGREIQKIKGTFADPMPKLLGRDGRLHPQYRITRTDTGRLSAANPNVLAFPKHSTRGKLVRDGFVPAPGREYGEWDYDQIEMRVFAHDSGDPDLIAEFFSGLDKHCQTAGLLYARDATEIYAEYKADTGTGGAERFAAKAVNFGILMGITAHGLLAQFHKAGQLHWTLGMCEDVLRKWNEAYPVGADYIQRKHAEARRYGYVRDMWGRLRWLEGIHAFDDYIRAGAERQAQATPTQSGAQGIVKRGMAALWPLLKDFRRQGIWVECLLQVHDALILEYPVEHRELIDSTVMAVMHSAIELKVPVTAKAKFGQRWGDL